MPRMMRMSARSRALRQRERDEQARSNQNFVALTSRFENSIRSLFFMICSRCRKSAERCNFEQGLCRSCRQLRFNKFSPENGMDLGSIPTQLSELTMIEQILIARVHPVVSVFQIRGQQRAYSGHVMNFVQHIEQIASRLPHDPANLDSVLLLSRSTPHGIAQFKVRSERIRTALKWLKEHNQYYRDIIIDEDIIQSLPTDGDISERLQNIPTDSDIVGNDDVFDNIIGRSCYPNLPALNQVDAISREINQMSSSQNSSVEEDEWPIVSQNPINEFTSEGYICKAFPVLFPYGRGDINSPRIEKIKNHEYFRYLMSYHDGRFAKDARFPYFAFNTLSRWDALNSGNVFVRRNLFDAFTAADIRDIIDSEDSDLAAAVMYYGSTLRGTRAYWKKRCTELIQMVRQFGTPNIFFTLSAADYHWPDLFRILCHGDDPVDLTDQQRRSIMHENPHKVAWFFEKRTNIFMREFMLKFFAVKDFWFRFEWQHRGSPHVHGMLWLENAPDCNDIDSLSETARKHIVEYFDKMVSASLNGEPVAIPSSRNPCRRRFSDLSQNEKANDLFILLNSIQRHSRCGSYCIRKKRGSRTLACRYGFPIQVEPESSLKFENGSWKFIPKRDDRLLQRYNSFVTQVWRGNTDFSPITSKDAVINYIAKYASKGEFPSENYTEVLKRLINRNQDDTPAASLIRQLLVSSVAERNYSAQEVMHLLSGWPLYHCSRSIVILALRDDWRRLNNEQTPNITALYSNREADYGHLSLFEFAKSYRHQSNRTVKRTKDCIVRVVPFLKLSDDPVANEEYYKLNCKLYRPWRINFEESLPVDMSWQELYLRGVANIERADEFANEFPHMPDEVEFEPAPYDHEDIVRDAGMALARIEPLERQNEDPLGHRPIDEAFCWATTITANITLDQINSFLPLLRLGLDSERFRAATIPIDSLSPEQRKVLRICERQVADSNHQIKRIIVQGKAGTGKSAVIKAMCKILDEKFPSSTVYQVVAPTGAAAVNIDGKTIHSFFSIPMAGDLIPLEAENLRRFQLRFRAIRFIIIDEYSMIGMRLLNKIHKRLCEAKGNTDDPFGGVFIYLFGDLRQLPPVKDIAIYMEPKDNFSRFALRLIDSFQEKILLSVSHRQDNDQLEFKSMLDDLATGQISQQGWQLLMQRRVAIRPQNQNTFRDCIHLYPTNMQVTQQNNSALSRNQQAVAVIEAEHNNSTALQGGDQSAQGLQRKLYISIGCRVILRKNLFVDRGLVNGSLGTVKDIIWKPNERPPLLPLVILIEFDRFNGPFIRDRCFPLLPVNASWREQGVECVRRQYPINLAYALTIHKSQGLTLEKAFVDIGDREAAAGITYVALSRVRRLEDLLILRSFNYSRLAEIGKMKMVIEREKFMRQMRLNI